MKGQSAVEYVMTYGWAILALILVTGFLLASGVLNPNYIITEECNLGSNLPCQAIVFNEDGTTKMLLRVYNGFPYEVKLNSMEVILKDTGESFGEFETNVRLASGGEHTYESTITGPPLTAGEVKRFSAVVIYVSCAPEVSSEGCGTSEHTISGRIVAIVNEA